MNNLNLNKSVYKMSISEMEQLFRDLYELKTFDKNYRLKLEFKVLELVDCLNMNIQRGGYDSIIYNVVSDNEGEELFTIQYKMTYSAADPSVRGKEIPIGCTKPEALKDLETFINKMMWYIKESEFYKSEMNQSEDNSQILSHTSAESLQSTIQYHYSFKITFESKVQRITGEITENFNEKINVDNCSEIVHKSICKLADKLNLNPNLFENITIDNITILGTIENCKNLNFNN